MKYSRYAYPVSQGAGFIVIGSVLAVSFQIPSQLELLTNNLYFPGGDICKCC